MSSEPVPVESRSIKWGRVPLIAIAIPCLAAIVALLLFLVFKETLFVALVSAAAITLILGTSLVGNLLWECFRPPLPDADERHSPTFKDYTLLRSLSGTNVNEQLDLDSEMTKEAFDAMSPDEVHRNFSDEMVRQIKALRKAMDNDLDNIRAKCLGHFGLESDPYADETHGSVAEQIRLQIIETAFNNAYSATQPSATDLDVSHDGTVQNDFVAIGNALRPGTHQGWSSDPGDSAVHTATKQKKFDLNAQPGTPSRDGLMGSSTAARRALRPPAVEEGIDPPDQDSQSTSPVALSPSFSDPAG